MINIRFFTREGQLTGFKMVGHADYADHGNDIICAAVSILALNTVNSIETFTEDFKNIDLEESSGKLTLILKESISPESQLLLKSLKLGVTSIQKDYGKKYIHIKTEEV